MQLLSDLTMSSAGQSINANSGVINLNGKVMTLHNVVNSTGTFEVLGNFTITGNGNFNVFNYSQGVYSSFTISGAPVFRVINKFRKFNSSSANFHAGTATSPLYVDGDFEHTTGYFGAPAIMYIGGSWNRTGGTFVHNNGKVIFSGSRIGAEMLSTTEAFYYVCMNKAAGSIFTINAGRSMNVTNKLEMISGNFVTVAATGIVVACDATTSGGNANSFVSGPLTLSICVATPVTLYYPTGRRAAFRPVWLTPTQPPVWQG